MHDKAQTTLAVALTEVFCGCSFHVVPIVLIMSELLYKPALMENHKQNVRKRKQINSENKEEVAISTSWAPVPCQSCSSPIEKE